MIITQQPMMRFPKQHAIVICLVVIFCLGLIIASCGRKEQKAVSVSLRDSVLKLYLSTRSAAIGYDTANKDHRLLRAYYSNDTEILKSYLTDLDLAKEYAAYTSVTDSCIKIGDLQELKDSEAYRLYFTEKYGITNVVLTVRHRRNNGRDTTSLHAIIFCAARKDHPCEIAKSYDGTLSQKDWLEFKRKIEYCDFWYSNKYDNSNFLDPTRLQIDGFRHVGYFNPIPTSHTIVRHYPERLVFFQLFEFLLRKANFDIWQDACYMVWSKHRKAKERLEARDSAMN